MINNCVTALAMSHTFDYDESKENQHQSPSSSSPPPLPSPLITKKSKNHHPGGGGKMRKKQKMQPLLESTIHNMVAVMPDNGIVKSTAFIKAATTPYHVNKDAALSAKFKGSPAPVAVARRNARERNRVKQVNNGFAALRQHIPHEVAEAFEAAGNGRGASKKLSKVETLRMAVEYIRSLERLLKLENLSETMSSLSHQSLEDSNSLLSMSPDLSDQAYFIDGDSDPCCSDDISLMAVDCLPETTVIDNHHYFRIPGTNTYQVYSLDETAANDENLNPDADISLLVDNNLATAGDCGIGIGIGIGTNSGGDVGQVVLDDNITTTTTTTTTTNGNLEYNINAAVHIRAPASLSPGALSGQSLSPAATVTSVTISGVPVTQTLTDTTQKTPAVIKQEQICYDHVGESFIALTPDNGFRLDNRTFGGVFTLKTELKDDNARMLNTNRNRFINLDSLARGYEWT